MTAGPPREVFGQYLIYEQLGMGGMAEVHRAEVEGLEGFRRTVALKRMLPHVANNRDLVQAFVREARLASHLRHTNVPQTYELGMVDGIYFIAMEYIEGHTLREVLQHCGPTTGPVPVPVALNILNQLCDALDYAHNLTDETGIPLGIIHRDVSPSNIIIAPGGVLKLIDFGIAKVADTTMQTMSGTIKGKFGYMAPEYIAGHLDARADLFAIGVIAHELLTNRPLFTGSDDMQTLQRVQVMDVIPPSKMNKHVPKEIDEIVMTALERNPDRRWQQASALRQALTTMTKRLGLAIPEAQVMTWLTSAFEHTRPSLAIVPPQDYSQSSASMIIEQPMEGRQHTVTDVEATEIALATSHTVTTHSHPMLAMADSTMAPSASASATPTVEIAAHAFGPATPSFGGRHDVQHPTDSMLADDLFPTLVRGSRPSFPGMGGSGPPAGTPRGFPPPDPRELQMPVRPTGPINRLGPPEDTARPASNRTSDAAPAAAPVPTTMRGPGPVISSVRPPSSLDSTPGAPPMRRVASSPNMQTARPSQPASEWARNPRESESPDQGTGHPQSWPSQPGQQRGSGQAPARQTGRAPEPKLRVGLLVLVMFLAAAVVAALVYVIFSRVL